MTNSNSTRWEIVSPHSLSLSAIPMTRLCARIGHVAMQNYGTAPHDNAGGRLPNRKAKADTGTQHGRKAVSCPKAIGHD